MASNALKPSIAGLPFENAGTAPVTQPRTSFGGNAQDLSRPQSDWRAPEKYFERRMFTDGVMTMPDGVQVPFWGFEDPAAPGQKSFPSPAIRIREGEVAHVKLEMLSAAPASQGVMPNAFAKRDWSSKPFAPSAIQKTESYIYQWQPKSAGTWLYQSHTSSPLNFEMGLYGLLIVDPEPDTDGLPRAYAGGPSYNVERCFILDDIDPNWHAGPVADAKAGNTGAVSGLRFDPKYFLINGVPNTLAMHDEKVAIDAKRGDKVLIRLLNASFSLVRFKIEGLDSNIVAVDGKALGSAERPWTKWSPVKASQPVYMATGARNDVLIDLDPEVSGIEAGGDYLITFEFLDWEKRELRNASAPSPVHVGRVITRIRVV